MTRDRPRRSTRNPRRPLPLLRPIPALALALGVALAQGGCVTATRDGHEGAPRKGLARAASRATSQPGDFVAGYAALADERRGLIHFVVEIPAGGNDKWEVDKRTGELHWEQKDGRPRVVQYLPYPGNYGMIPRTSLPSEVGGDGDPLDVLLLGRRVERGRVVRARPIGLLRLVDGGERDDKILAVPLEGPLSDVRDMRSLDTHYPGVRTIVETWFTRYKSTRVAAPDEAETRSTSETETRRAPMRSEGFGDADEALRVVREASRYFERAQEADPVAR